VANSKIDEVFIGSCMTNIGHFRAASKLLEGKRDIPVKLWMGNQAQVKEGTTVMSTSTRNFPNRLGKNTNVYLGSAELAAICSKLGRIPTKAEYLADIGVINQDANKIYQYLNFDKIAEYKEAADAVTV
jgi:aconitate hydratase 2 / 2-methylisocitrate dehydratase